SLARADRHNVVDVLRQLRIGLWCRYRMRLPLTLLRLRRVRQLDVDLHLADATDGLGRRAHFADECARILGVQQELDADLAVGIRLERGDVSAADHVLAGPRVLDAGERIAHGVEQCVTIDCHLYLPVKRPAPTGAPAVTQPYVIYESFREDAGHFRHGEHDAPLDPLLQRQGRNRAGAAGADETKLDDAVVFVVIDELDVAAIGTKGGTDRIQDFLDSVACRGAHSASPPWAKSIRRLLPRSIRRVHAAPGVRSAMDLPCMNRVR